MSMENELGGLLRNKANDVPHHSEAPRSLTRRVRRRMAFNAAIVGTALVVIAGGAFVGVRMLNGPKPIAPAGSVPTTSVAPTPLGSKVTSSAPPTSSSAAAAPSCTAGQLRAVGSLQGAAGSREGEIDLTNFSDTVCTLQGSPTLTLLDQNLKPITSGVTFSSSPPGWKVDGSSRPPGWPVVSLRPGDAAAVRMRWSNWCPNGRQAPLWRVSIPSGGTVDVNGLDAASPPPCNGSSLPSTIEVGPFEPGRSR